MYVPNSLHGDFVHILESTDSTAILCNTTICYTESITADPTVIPWYITTIYYTEYITGRWVARTPVLAVYEYCMPGTVHDMLDSTAEPKPVVDKHC